jgi:hypothetical protein
LWRRSVRASLRRKLFFALADRTNGDIDFYASAGAAADALDEALHDEPTRCDELCVTALDFAAGSSREAPSPN